MTIKKIDRQVVSTTLENDIDSRITRTEFSDEVARLDYKIETWGGQYWKDAVPTYADIATTYPNPQDGWMVTVMDTDYTYVYNGLSWVVISANSIPVATEEMNGLISKENIKKINSVEYGAQKNMSMSDIFTNILSMDGTGSGLDADRFQGYNLDHFAIAGHNHDGAYYTKTLTDTMFSGKADKNNALLTGRPVVRTAKNKADGLATEEAFRIESKDFYELFQVMTNGDTVIGGVLKVNGTGDSSFAGNVNIGGNLRVDGTIIGGTEVDLGDDLIVKGVLSVQGNTILGDNATEDTTIIKGVTTVYSPTTKELADGVSDAFRVVDINGVDLFNVKQNGDTVIGGVLKVNGAGDSTFAGNINIGGHLTVDGNIIGGAQVELGENLLVKGDTVLGDDATADTTTIKGETTIFSKTTKALGNKTDNAFKVVDSTGADLFNVKTNGDTVIGGVLTVNGTGDSTFAGNVNIGGNLVVDGTVTSGTKVDLGDDLVVTGNMTVKGNTILGDDPVNDTVTMKAVTKVVSKNTKANGVPSANVFFVEDSVGAKLFEVRETGDTVIGGVLTVNGTGESTFAGNVNIGGSLVVDGDIIGGTQVRLAEDLNITGNLNVEGNTTLGNNSGEDITTIKGLTTIYSKTSKDLGSSTANTFVVRSSLEEVLFAVKENGDTVIGGVLTVNGAGDSSFAGNVSIGGHLTVDGNIIGGAQVHLGNDMTVDGNILVKGSTTLGDNAEVDKTDIKGLTTIYSAVTKLLGNSTDDVLKVVDSEGSSLFNVKTNGDTVIGGVLTVNGTGDSTFAGNVNIGGSLRVDGTITSGTQVDLGEDLVVNGNMNVKGSTTLGDDATNDTTTIKGVTKVISKTTKALGSSTVNVFNVQDSVGNPLFEVRESGDTVIAGTLTVNGQGDSTFAGNVNIGGSLQVNGDIVGGTQVTLGQDLDIAGNLNVKGNTVLGDDASMDSTTIKGITSIFSKTTKALGSNTLDTFAVKDSSGANLFSVKENGDTTIGGVLTVNGAGQSTFNGDVSINGKLTVAQDATVSADMSSNNFTVKGNLLVEGNTVLGDASTDTISVKGTMSVEQDLNMNSKKITNVSTPVNPNDVANKSYVDNAIQGLDPKHSARVATTANITLSGTQTIDGVVLAVGDRVLVKDQTTKSQNGIYNVQTGAWTRTSDADTSAKLNNGAFIFVEQGTVNADSGWVLSTDGAITVGSTNIDFVQFSGAGQISAGNGLTKTGNTLNVVGTTNRIIANADSIDIASTYVGQTSITTLGTIATGTWQGSTVGVAYGGTGATNAVNARANLGATGKYSATIGNATASSFTINHNLNSTEVIFMVREATTGNIVYTDGQIVDANNIKITFDLIPALNEYKVVVIG